MRHAECRVGVLQSRNDAASTGSVVSLADLTQNQLRSTLKEADYNVPAQRFGLPVGEPSCANMPQPSQGHAIGLLWWAAWQLTAHGGPDECVPALQAWKTRGLEGSVWGRHVWGADVLDTHQASADV